jgi:hypothetical protein
MKTLRSALALTLAAPLSAQAPEMVLRIGDAVPGAGAITDIERVHVAGGGSWRAQVRTNDPVAHTVLLAPAYVDVTTGSALASLGGGVVSGLRAGSWDLFTIPTWIADVSGASFAQALMFGTGVQFQSGAAATTYTTQFPVGSTWRSFDELYYTPNNPAYLMRGSIDDPLGGKPDLSFAAVAWHGGSIGALSHVDVIALESELAPGLARTIEHVRSESGRAQLDLWGGRVLWSCDLDGSTLDDGCVFLTVAGPVHTTTLLAREGSPSPVAGRTWGALEDISVFVNGQGKWALRAQLDASDPSNDEVLVRDGAVFAREGEVHAATSPWPIESLGAVRPWIDDHGAMLWFARWNDPATPGADEALFLGDLELVRTGATSVAGLQLVDIESGPDSASLELIQGEQVVFVGSLSDGTRGLLRVDLDEVQAYCTAKWNSAGCLPLLSWGGFHPSASSQLPFLISGAGLLPHQPCVLFYGKDGQAAIPLGGGLLCVAPPLWRLPAASTGGTILCSGKFSIDFNDWIQSGADPFLQAGQRVYAQLWQRDPGFAPPLDVGLTNALRFAIAP